MTYPETLTVAGITLPCVRDDEHIVQWIAEIHATPRTRLVIQSKGHRRKRRLYIGGLLVDGRCGLPTRSFSSPDAAAADLAALLGDLRAALAGVPGGGA